MSIPSVGELERQGKKGASFRIHASAYKKYDFQRIAKACAEGGGMLTIFEASYFSERDREDIGKFGGVTFDF